MRSVSVWQGLVIAFAVLICGGLAGHFQLRASQRGASSLAATARADQPDTRGDWWMAGHDARHTGRSAFSGPHTATLRFKFRSTGPGTDFTTAALGRDGAVYAGCGSNLAALDTSGRERWFLPLRGRLSQAVLTRGGRLYVTDGQGQLLCISTDGEVKWCFAVPGGLRMNGMLVHGETAVLTGQDDTLHAVNSLGKENWTYGVADQYVQAGPVADAAGSIFVALGDLGIQELSPAGELLYTYKLPETSINEFKLYGDGTFLIRDYDSIYQLTRDGQKVWTWDTSGKYIPADMALRGDGTAYYGDDEGVVHAISARGRELWRFKSGARIVATPALGQDGSIAVMDDQATLTVLDLNGTPRYQKKLAAGTWFGTSPAFSSNGALFASGGGYLHALDSNGAELWKFSGGGTFSSTPLLAADGAIYAPCTDNTLYVLNPDGTQRRQQQLESSIMFTSALTADGTLLASAGNKLCAVPPGGGTAWEFDTGGYLASSPAIDPAGMIYLGTDDGRLLALTPDGTLLWAYQTKGHIMGSGPALGSDGMLYIGTGLALNPPAPDPNDPSGIAGQEDGALYAVKPDGTLAWRFSAGSSIWTSPVIADDGTIYIASTLGMTTFGGMQDENAPAPCGKLFALTPGGKEQWSHPLLEITQHGPALGADGTIYICSWNRSLMNDTEPGGLLYAFSPKGQLKWQGPYGCIGAACVGADGTIYSSGADSKLYALSPAGKVLWSYQLGEAVSGSPSISRDGTLYVGCSDGFLYAFKDP